MRKLGLAALTAALSVGMAASASASTVLTGTIPTDGSVFGAQLIAFFNSAAFGVDFPGEHGHLDLGPGAYAIQFSATGDIGGLQLGEAVNQQTLQHETGLFPGDFEFDSALFVQDLPGGNFEDYHAGDVISGSLLVPQDTTAFADFGIGTITTTNNFSGVVAVSGFAPQGSPGGGTWTLTIADAAVPEPAAWVLMIAGFGAAGAVLRRRRRLAGATAV